MEVVLTNMCMVYNSKHQILVMNRVKNDWPGLTFPGGHVEENEDHLSSVIREMKEETGLIISSVEPCGFIEWVSNENKREITLLYRTNKYQGEIISSKEGEVFWLDIDKLNKYPFSLDFDKVLEICLKNI